MCATVGRVLAPVEAELVAVHGSGRTANVDLLPAPHVLGDESDPAGSRDDGVCVERLRHVPVVCSYYR